MTLDELEERMRDAWNNSPEATEAMPRALKVVLQAIEDGEVAYVAFDRGTNGALANFSIKLQPEFAKFLKGE